MRPRRSDFPKLVAIIGGFLIMAGMILLGVAALATAGYLEVGLFLEGKFILTFAIFVIAVGLLDAVSAVIIARW